MTWTTDYPTKPGFYWIRNYRRFHLDKDPETADPVIVQVDQVGDFYLIGVNTVHFKDHVVSAEWQGPVEPESEKPASPPRYDLFPETICADCLERSSKFISWPTGEADGKFTFALICRDCWIKRLTPEQRKVYMV